MELDIHRLNMGLRLAGDAQRLDEVARRLRDLAVPGAPHLPTALQQAAMSKPPGADDGALIFIDRLEVHCHANTAWDDEAIATHLARRLAHALQGRLTQPGLRRFSDRAEYVAAALLALADASLPRCWWFAEFDGLHSLSTSTALRTLLINEGEVGISALARLTQTTQQRLINTLGEGDSARLLARLAMRSAPTATPVAVLWAAAQRMTPTSASSAWLEALINAERSCPGSAGATALQALRALVALHQLASEGQLAAAPTGAEPRTALAHWLTRHGLASAWVADAAQADIGPLAAELGARAATAADRSQANPTPWLYSPHGGLFVLLGRLQRMGWLARWQTYLQDNWPAEITDADTDADSNADTRVDTDSGMARADALSRALALQVAACALAGRGAQRVLADPALQAICGLAKAQHAMALQADLAARALCSVLHPGAAATNPPADPDDSAAQLHRRPLTPRPLKRLLAQAARRLLADCGRALPGLGGSTPAFLRRQALDLPARLHIADDDHAEAAHTDSQVRLGRAPLDVLLVLAGVRRCRIALPGVPAIRCTEEIGA